MHLLIDLQGAQTASRHRGIGRYTLGLATELARQRGPRRVSLLLNGHFPETIESLRAAFDGLVPAQDLHVWQALGPMAAHEAGNGARRRAAACVRQAVVARCAPDLLLDCSPFEGLLDDAVTALPAPPAGLRTVALLHDLIPLAHPETYLADPATRAWYAGCLDTVRRADHLLANSHWTAGEAVHRLGVDAAAVSAISAAVHERFQPQAAAASAEALARRGIVRPFVLCTSAGDARKNNERLLQAWARLPAALRTAHQLVLVGSTLLGEVGRGLQRSAAAVGLGAGELVVIDDAGDAELVSLLRACLAAVQPSWHEGFGLPALEAMACGRAVIASATSSLPEVIGCDEALFDPLDVAAIAARLAQVMGDGALRARLEQHGLQRAKAFSWARSAQQAWNALDHVAGSRPTAVPAAPARPPQGERPRLLYVPCGANSTTPGATAREAALLPELGRFYRLELLDTGEHGPVLPGAGAAGRLRSLDWALEHAAAFDRIVYAVAAGPNLATSLAMMSQWPGVAWLLDRELERLLPAADASALQQRRREQVAREGWTALSQAAAPGRLGLGRLPGAFGFLLEGMARPGDAPDPDDAPWAARCHALPAPGEGAGGARAAAAAWAAGVEALQASRMPDAAGVAGEIAEQAPSLTPQERERLARALHASLPPEPRRPRWLLDVSELAQRDSRSGIQRVVKALLHELVRQVPPGIELQPVFATADEPGYRYAQGFMSRFLGEPWGWEHDGPVQAWPGDLFFGLDFQAQVVATQHETLTAWRRLGVRTGFLVHDLLPLQRPDCFGPGARETHQRWLETVAAADFAVCVSQAVADELHDWLDCFGAPGPRPPFALHVSHNGADLEAAAPSRGLPDDAAALLARLRRAPALLMVGTLEPRKGHAQVLAAMERLWQRGEAASLVIVGRAGWQVQALVERLRGHAEAGRRLHWLEGASDEYLEAVYAASSGLLMASEGEGFGLPLIEAARHGLPLLVRDLPVFREVAGPHASYFPDSGDAELLADAVAAWLAGLRSGQAPPSAGIRPLRWQDSAAHLCRILAGEAAAQTWTPRPGLRLWGNDPRHTSPVGQPWRRAVRSTGQAGCLYEANGLQAPAGAKELVLRLSGTALDGSERVELSEVSRQGETPLVSAGLGAPGAPPPLLRLPLQRPPGLGPLSLRVFVGARSQLALEGVEIPAAGPG